MIRTREQQDLSKWQPAEPLYTALTDLEFGWYRDEIKTVKGMWNAGASIWKIAKKVDRDPDEVACIVMDLARNKKIKNRPRGVWG